jgi:hypothetical protein
VRLNQRPLRAFPERLDGYCGQRNVHSLCMAPSPGMRPAQRLQSVQDPLAETLPFQQYPVIQPARQQFKRIDHLRWNPHVDGSRRTGH